MVAGVKIAPRVRIMSSHLFLCPSREVIFARAMMTRTLSYNPHDRNKNGRMEGVIRVKDKL